MTATPRTDSSAAATPSAPVPARHSAALDGLRGVALIGVVAFHGGILPFGWLGVPVFFVLSGHFITRILLERRAATRAATLMNFLRNRALRLAPLYLLACLVLTGLAVTKHGPRQIGWDLPWLWTWTYNLRPLTAGWVDNDLYDHLWSLGVEVQLYLVWAALALLLSRRVFIRTLVVLALTGPLIRLIVWGLLSMHYSHDQLLNITYYFPSTYLDAFALGALTALPEVQAKLPGPRRLLAPVLSLVVGVAALEVLLTAFRHHRFRGDLGFPITFADQAGWVWGYTLVAVLAATLLWTALHPGALRDALGTRVLARVGLISYGIYVLHRPIGWVTDRALPDHQGTALRVVATAGVLVVSVVAASITFRWFETPFIARKRNPLALDTADPTGRRRTASGGAPAA